ncbi:MAG TPA: hypothetical protein DCM27_06220 [Rhodospirillaceae bacterium]|nr:hypothetical protein [Rhodospirillaceae bacterium]
MTHFILSFLILVTLPFSVIAADYDQKQPILIKGSKSYQVRYHKPSASPVQNIEPAAGNEDGKTISQDQKSAMPTGQSTGTGESQVKKSMILHGKK